MSLLKFITDALHEVFVDRTQQVLRDIERRLQTAPFVRVSSGGGGAGSHYLVTAVHRDQKRLAYFTPSNHANMMTDWSEFPNMKVVEDQTFDLKPNRELNALIWQTFQCNKPYIRDEHRRRLGYDARGRAIYILKGLHIHKGDEAYRKRWGDVAVFQVASLDIDVGEGHYHGFAYYPGYGTRGITVDIGEWEPNPRYVDYAQLERDRLHQEYLDYKASPPFEEGDIIQAQGFPQHVFVRYEDVSRTRMVVYPGKVITGADNIARYKLVERRGLASKGAEIHLPRTDNPVTVEWTQ